MIFDKTKKIKLELDEKSARILELEQVNLELKNRLEQAEIKNAELKRELESLREKSNQLEQEVGLYARKTEVLQEEADKILLNAKEKAKQIEDQAVQLYRAEINRLRDFIARYQANLPEPKQRTPESKKRAALCALLAEILNDRLTVSDLGEGAQLLQKLSDAMGGGASSEGTFNLEEVLNPAGDLDLAALCKELGVME